VVRALLLVVVTSLLALAACDEEEDRAAPERDERPAAAGREARPDPGPLPGGRALARATTRDRLDSHLRALQRIADRSGGNRAAGTDGDRATAGYIAATLREAGYRVTTQRVRFPFYRERSARLELLPGGALRRGTDFRTLAYSGSGAATGRVRAVPDLGCDAGDFAAVRRGEIALVERGTCTFRSKVERAERADAAALLVWDRGTEGEPVSGTLGDPGARIPALLLNAGAGERIADGSRVRVEVDTVSERRTTRNVLAEGPDASGRVVMAGGHLDSVPAGPGLNDNGSGVAALLSAAEAIRARGPIRFGFWGAEELGLIGSRRYVRSLSRPERRRIAGYVNLDMVGSPTPARSVYDSDNRIETALRNRLDRLTDDPIETRSLGGGSDHSPFQRAGIAVGGLFTGADDETDPCYHRRCDTIRNVNAKVATEMAKTLAAALPALTHRP
jgi:peptidase M28-like protein/PA domain-containing protein